MAGMIIASILLFLAQCEGFEVNAKECTSNGVVLSCSWRGKGNYVVSGVLSQETIEFNKLMSGCNLLIPPVYLGNLRKVEVMQGDISCGEINAPPVVTIYIEKRRCVSMQCINVIKFYSYSLLTFHERINIV